MKKKRILFILSSLKFGGAEKHTIKLINNLDQNKFELGLCYLEKKHDLIEELNSKCLSIQKCCEKTIRFDLKVLNCLKKQADRFNPDMVICVDPYTGFYAQMLRSFKKVRFELVHILHQTIMSSFYNEVIVKLLYRYTINKSNQVIFVCNNQMNYWVEKYGIKKRLSKSIYNGIDTEFFRPEMVQITDLEHIKNQYSIEEPDIVIGICAVLRPEKKHCDLLEAFKRIVGSHSHVKLLIIGDGPEKKSIQSKIGELGLETFVSITGFQNDVRPYMSLSDIIAITSSTVETFSIAILEAMSMGKSIIASDIGGASEQVIDGKNGYLYVAGDIDDLTIKLSKMLDRKLLHTMGIQSRKMVKEKFEERQMIKSYENTLYTDG